MLYWCVEAGNVGLPLGIKAAGHLNLQRMQLLVSVKGICAANWLLQSPVVCFSRCCNTSTDCNRNPRVKRVEVLLC